MMKRLKQWLQSKPHPSFWNPHRYGMDTNTFISDYRWGSGKYVGGVEIKEVIAKTFENKRTCKVCGHVKSYKWTWHR